MDSLKKPLAVILGLTAVAVLLHFILTPLYKDTLDIKSVWAVIDYFMAFGVIVTLIATYADKKTPKTQDPSDGSCLNVNLPFYAAATLAVLFFWNWVNFLVVGADEGEINEIFWVVIDTLFVILIARMSVHLWTNSPGE